MSEELAEMFPMVTIDYFPSRQIEENGALLNWYWT